MINPTHYDYLRCVKLAAEFSIIRPNSIFDFLKRLVLIPVYELFHDLVVELMTRSLDFLPKYVIKFSQVFALKRKRVECRDP